MTKPLVVLSSHSAQLAGGEIAMARVAAALRRYQPHVLLGEDGPIAELLRRDNITVEVVPMSEELRTLGRDEWLGSTGGAHSAVGARIAELLYSD